MDESISVVVIDDHSLFRAGVIQALGLDSDIEVIGEGCSGADALELAKVLQPDIILLDISMQGNGIDAARDILALPEPPHVMMLTVSEKDSDILRALEVGAIGYVLKGVDTPNLIAAVKSVAAGDSFVSPNLTLRLLSGVREKAKPSLLASLTEQEERTLRLVASGMSNREVAERLGVIEKTVKFHMTRIMAKLKVKNRVQATLVARQEWD